MPTIYFAKQSGTFNTATGDTNYVSSLWQTDGTTPVSSLITQFNSGTTSLAGVDDITPFNTGVAFEGANRLRVSDGTTAGTSVFTDLRVGGITTAFGEILFGAYVPTAAPAFGLWASNGTPGNATLIKRIFGNFGTDTLTDFAMFNGDLYFIANYSGANGLGGSNGVYNGQLWKSDGTAEGTVLVQSLSASDLYHPDLAVSGGNLYFGGNTGTFTNDPRLYKIGSNGATSLVKDISGSIVTTSSPIRLTDVFGTLFFVTNDGTHGDELWKSDGTPAGTTLVKDINLGTANSSPNHLTAFNGALYFSANTTASGTELWKSDGTAGGTVMVKDIVDGAGSSTPSNFVSFNGALYFTAAGGIWKTDGSTAGTTLVIAGMTLVNPVAYGGSLYFESNVNGRNNLVRSDGTAAGTIAITEDVDTNAGIAITGSGASPGLIDSLSTNQQLQLIYIAYFNRAADGGGNTFWGGQNIQAQAAGQTAAIALTNIANSFTPQAETIALYPFLGTPNLNLSTPAAQSGLGAFIDSVYGNMFGRAADAAGKAFWVGQVTSGAVGLGAAALAIANGATGSDATELQNKITVALDFTLRTNAAGLGVTSTPASFLSAARSVLAGVDGAALNDASVAIGETATTNFISNSTISHASANSSGDPIMVAVSHSVIDPGPGSHAISFIAGAGADTLVPHAGGMEVITGFDPTTDALDLGSMLREANVALNGDIAELNRYVSITGHGSDAVIQFDPAGHGGGMAVATLQGLADTVTNLDALVARGSIHVS